MCLEIQHTVPHYMHGSSIVFIITCNNFHTLCYSMNNDLAPSSIFPERHHTLNNSNLVKDAEYLYVSEAKDRGTHYMEGTHFLDMHDGCSILIKNYVRLY